MPLKLMLFILLSLSIFTAHAKPRITVEHGKTLDGFARIKITNETVEKLACYVAIDGYKIKFKLQARQPSGWYKATDKSFHHANFSVWCDYLDKHPNF